LVRLAAEAPNVPEVRQELGQTYENLGRLRRDTDPAAAEKDYTSAESVAEKLVEDFPATPAYRQDLAAALNNRGVLLLALGKGNEAEAAFGRALTLKERLAAEVHWVADYRRDYGAGLNNRGIQLKTQDRSKDADKTFTRAAKVLSDLVAEYPAVPDYQRELARTLSNRALVRQSDGRADEAEALLHQALQIHEKLVAGRNALPEFFSERNRTRIALGALYQARALAGSDAAKGKADLGRAETEYRGAVEGFQQLVAQFPKEPDFQYQQGLASAALAGLLSARGQSSDARSEWGRTVAVLSPLADQHPQVVGYRLDLGRTLNDWALNCAITGDSKQAEELWNRASAALAELVRVFPKESAPRLELAKVENNRAVLALKSNRLDAATEAYRRAVAAVDGLPAASHAGPAYRYDQMTRHRSLAEQLAETGAATREVDAEWQRVIDLCRALVADAPNNSQYASDLGLAEHQLARHLLVQNRPADARTLLDSAIATQRAAIKLAPAPAYSTLLAEHLKLLKEVLFQLDDHAAAAAAAIELLKLKPADGSGRPEVAAEALARCAGIVAADSKLSESQRRESANEYADRAVVLLRQAVKNGFKDPQELKKKEFDALRQREDFKELQKQLGS
jgi:tetratricopeptide (TPR) repeat protein